MQQPRTASIGFRAKTAKAIAIAVEKNGDKCAFAARWDVTLYNPAIPATGQPHHEVMELSWTDAQVAVQRFERQIEAIANEALQKIASELRSKGFFVSAVGIVGSPDRKLEKIGNPHIRAHAAEGILFRRVLEIAATDQGLNWRSFSDRTFALESHKWKTTLAAVGAAAGKPWRVDERLAAAAAWLALE